MEQEVVSTTEEKSFPLTEIVDATKAIERVEEEPEIPEGKDIMVFARTPAEMAQAQSRMVAFVAGKIEQCKGELKIAEDNLEHAVKAKLRKGGWQHQVKQWRASLNYYGKMLSALEAGYAIVPDFPFNVIGVRTQAVEPTDQGYERWRGNVAEEKAEQLPAGMGHYVDPTPAVASETTTSKDEKGQEQSKTLFFAKSLRAVDLPFKKVRPQIIKDMQRALELKIFDKIGALPNTKRHRDPMLVGIIEVGKGTSRKQLTFLISWWVPLDTL